MIVWDSVLQVILLLCPAIIPGIAFFVFRNIYDKQAELEEQSKHLMEHFGPTEEATEPEATAQQLLNAGVVTAREARTLAGVETLELEPGKVKCEYCDSIVDAGTNCPNCGAALPAPKAQPCAVDLYYNPGSFDSLLVNVARFGQVAHDLGARQRRNGV